MALILEFFNVPIARRVTFSDRPPRPMLATCDLFLAGFVRSRGLHSAAARNNWRSVAGRKSAGGSRTSSGGRTSRYARPRIASASHRARSSATWQGRDRVNHGSRFTIVSRHSRSIMSTFTSCFAVDRSRGNGGAGVDVDQNRPSPHERGNCYILYAAIVWGERKAGVRPLISNNSTRLGEDRESSARAWRMSWSPTEPPGRMALTTPTNPVAKLLPSLRVRNRKMRPPLYQVR